MLWLSLSCALLDLTLASTPALILVDDIPYRVSVVADSVAWNHITVDAKDNVFFRDLQYNMFVLEKDSTTPQRIQGVAGISHDSCVDELGNVLIATFDGIFKYDHQTISATSTAHGMLVEVMYAADNGSIFLDDQNNWFELRPGALLPRQLSALHRKVNLAFGVHGELYYGEPSERNHPYVLHPGDSRPQRIEGIEFGYNYINAVDKCSGNIFMCNSYGLYVVKPDSHSAERVEGLLDVTSVAFDHSGNIFIGAQGKTLRLTPLQKNPCWRQLTTNNVIREWTFYKLTLYYELLSKIPIKKKYQKEYSDLGDNSDNFLLVMFNEVKTSSFPYWCVDIILTITAFIIVFCFTHPTKFCLKWKRKFQLLEDIEEQVVPFPLTDIELDNLVPASMNNEVKIDLPE